MKNLVRGGMLVVALVLVAGTARAQMGGHMGGGAGGMGSDHMQQMHQMQQMQRMHQMMNDVMHQAHCMTQDMQRRMQDHQCEMMMDGHGMMQRMHAPEGRPMDHPHPMENPNRTAVPQPAPRPRE